MVDSSGNCVAPGSRRAKFQYSEISFSASFMAGSLSPNHGGKKWMRSMVTTANEGTRIWRLYFLVRTARSGQPVHSVAGAGPAHQLGQGAKGRCGPRLPSGRSSSWRSRCWWASTANHDTPVVDMRSRLAASSARASSISRITACMSIAACLASNWPVRGVSLVNMPAWYRLHISGP